MSENERGYCYKCQHKEYGIPCAICKINYMGLGDRYILDGKINPNCPLLRSDNMTKIEELETKVAELQKEIDELKSGKDTNVLDRWVPKIGEKYWSIGVDLLLNTTFVSQLQFNDDGKDKILLARNCIYKTEEIAERMLDYYLALEEARWYPTEEEWEDEGLSKYYGYYEKSEMCVDDIFTMRENIPYFKTVEECQSFYDKWQAEALIDWGIRSEL